MSLPPDCDIRLAQGNDDALKIHALLLGLSDRTVLIGRPNPVKALAEILRVMDHEYVFVATAGDDIVGTLGLVKADLWYSDDTYYANRWFHFREDYRHHPLHKEMLSLATHVARSHEMEFVRYREKRNRRGEFTVTGEVL